MGSKTQVPDEFSDEEKAYAQVVVQVVAQIVTGLSRTLVLRTEVVLHDLTRFPHTIVAIADPMTGRGPGGPPTDLGLRTFSENPIEDLIGYRTRVEGGPEMRSSSLFFRAPSGRAVVALCMNSDVTELQQVRRILNGFVSTEQEDLSPPTVVQETFPASVESLTQGILNDAITASGVEVGLMKKAHKVRVVGELQRRGFFTLRESVDLAAKNLEVSRYTIYNYLNELQQESPGEPAGHSQRA
ncbi:MAG: PAS domain-containing protein [Microbacterium sp.]